MIVAAEIQTVRSVISAAFPFFPVMLGTSPIILFRRRSAEPRPASPIAAAIALMVLLS